MEKQAPPNSFAPEVWGNDKAGAHNIFGMGDGSVSGMGFISTRWVTARRGQWLRIGGATREHGAAARSRSYNATDGRCA